MKWDDETIKKELGKVEDCGLPSTVLTIHAYRIAAQVRDDTAREIVDMLNERGALRHSERCAECMEIESMLGGRANCTCGLTSAVFNILEGDQSDQ